LLLLQLYLLLARLKVTHMDSSSVVWMVLVQLEHIKIHAQFVRVPM